VNPGSVCELQYELQVAGHLDRHWADRLGGLDIAHDHDGTTTLTGGVLDQAHLHGILAGIRDIGADLLAVRSRPSRPSPSRPGPIPHAVGTDRLVLRPATPDDVDATWNYRQLPAIGTWMTQLPTDIDAHRERFRNPDRLATTVIVELDRQVIGDLRLCVQDARAPEEITDLARRTQGELSWVLDPEHQGHGYATEAVRALIHAAFTNLSLRRVTATCFRDDHASRRLMERLGMRREAYHVRDTLHRSGRWLDTLTYAALTDDRAS
jgi:RimJ/RimL family protein N-acetyltransferase